MCSVCGQSNYIRCNCQSEIPFCDQCAEDNICIDKMDLACFIYHFGNPTQPTRLINLGLPNGSSAQTIFEAIDSVLGTSGNGPISVTDTNAIHIIVDGPGNRHLTPFLILSEQSGNTAVIKEDGLFVPTPENLYKVQVDADHIPYYLEDAIIGGTDGIVSISFEPTDGILFALPIVNIPILIDQVVNDSSLITSLTSAVVTSIVNNSSFLSTLTNAVENAILNDSSFITALTQTILNNPASLSLLCQNLNNCNFDCNCSGSTGVCPAPTINSANVMLTAGSTVQLTVDYNDSTPPPADGYLIFYRPVGSSSPYSVAGPFAPSSSPIQIAGLPVDNYEGYLESDCGGSFSSGVTFVTDDDISGNVTLSFGFINAPGLQTFSATLSQQIDANIHLSEIFADGFSVAGCGGTAVASAQTSIADSWDIPPGGTANSINPDSTTGTWASATHYKIYNVFVNGVVRSNGDILDIGSYHVTLVIPSCT